MTEPTDEAPVQDRPHDLDLRRDGTIGVTIEGEEYLLRRPKVGEFKKLRFLLHERQDDLLAKVVEVRKETARIAAEAKEAGDDADVDPLAVRRIEREYTEANEQANADWLREAFLVLSAKPLPADDDLPLWFTDGRTVDDVIRHWRNVPLLSGPS